MAKSSDDRRSRFVEVPWNTPPKGAEIVWFEGSEGRRLRACIAPALSQSKPRGTVIVCPGRTEFIEKYFEVGRELQQMGFALVILDWPGQGLSDRLLPDSKKGHIDRFETFMTALAKGLEAFDSHLPRPYISLAHSMGGAIALAAIAKGLVKVEAAAFCAPMWGIKSPVLGMRYLVWAMRATGRSGDYAMQPGPPERFETNIVTHDKRRWDLQRALIDAQPDLELGPVTWGWLGASLDIFSAFSKPKALASIDIPVFVASAGEEKLVDNASHAKIAARLKDCDHITVDGAMHEILMETDDRRAEFWDGFQKLLKRAGI
ncbi:hydrolase, alpha/beta fold family [Hyphomonas neptunium ATCC 15444]|uniref:Hydrolase, alpha/beta fold family n=2 Tax=Hyphomonas TaxID=85 RepID=Q0C611_HYPNA|nr:MULTISPECIES: alpha/beta hydrolase [Hyphomonas]ABI77438.1 hydrolase, alpha/beta fold family [Hyphomonas neptunium ATCC 15444]KCZ94911.1 alpha/beta fold family hydrolase [Hyphomonas hirschiana VP5]